MKLYIDFETWSPVAIRRGTDAYLNPAKPLLCTYAFDDGPVQVIDFTDGSPSMIPTGDEIWAHNSFFDRMVMSKLLNMRTDIKQWRCSMALALAHGLPGGLDGLCQVFDVPVDLAKVKDGKRLIKKFCCRKQGFLKDEEWPLFIEYAKHDITAMRECIKRMPHWNYKGEELALWHLDQTINNRGFRIDRQLAEQTMAALAGEQKRLAQATWDATGGQVESATQRDKFLQYICEVQGVFIPDLRASTITEALKDETLDEGTRILLMIRLESSKTSGAKYKRVLECVGAEDRLRGSLQFAGASRTARWAGRMFQPHNLPRPTMIYKGDPDTVSIKQCVELLRTGRAELTTLFAPSINVAASNTTRGLIVSADGSFLHVGDFSSIEGRVNAWLANETWKVKAFREGQDLYKLIYAGAFGMDIKDVNKKQRQIGKVMELAMGYGGGVGAFLNMAAAYALDLDELGRLVPPTPRAFEAWQEAIAKNMTFGLSKEVYVACDTLKIGYRKANPEITQSWYQYEDAVRKVIFAGKPELKIQIGRLIFDCNGAWLRIKLPSGRYLCYAQPLIHVDGTISYFAWRNKRWSRTKTYGGKICENIVQAISRDLLAEAMVRIEAAGYPIVLHVHDEILAETPCQDFDRFIKLMSVNPPWAAGLPLKAEGFMGVRYEK